MTPTATFVVDKFLPMTGMERASFQLISRLSGKSTDVHVIVLRGAPPDPWETSATSTELGMSSGVFGRLKGLRQLRQALQSRDEQELIICVGAWSFVTCSIATLGCGRRPRFIIWEHSFLRWRLRHQPRIWVVAGLVWVFRRRIMSWVTVSNSSAEIALKLAPPSAPVYVIPNLVPPKAGPELHVTANAWPLLGSEATVRALGLGSLDTGKNWDLAIRAFARLPGNWQLVICGEGKRKARLQKLIDSLDLNGRVHLQGFVDDVGPFLHGSDILVHPSRAETFGFVFREAALAGLPIVSLDLPAMNEFVGTEFVGILSQSDPASFAACCLRAVELDGGVLVSGPSESKILELWSRLLADAPQD